MKIASRQNAWFKRVREALRQHDVEIVLEGRKHVADALAAGWTPVALISRGTPLEDFSGRRFIEFDPELFDQVSDTRAPQEVLGLFERPAATLDRLTARGDLLIVALDRVQDPGNVGTIIRLAAAFDAAGVALLEGCADPYGPKAIRSSVGAILSVPVVKTTIGELAATGLPMYAADLSGTTDSPPPGGAIIAFGSEGEGVSEELLRRSKPIRVAMSDRVESLNVAASAAIILWQAFNSRAAANGARR